MKISHFFAYEKKDGGAVILRCFLRDGTVQVPESLDGLKVTALSPYAFSAHEDPDAPIHDPLPDALMGNDLIKLTLPDNLRSIGRYCFYNCENLSSLEFGSALFDVGSGAFTGCHRIREINFHASLDDRTVLDELLGEIREEVLVNFLSPEDQSVTARLFFPSFYENGVENTPARILMDEVHGAGLYYRNAFKDKRLDLKNYDALFPYALAQEDEKTLIRISLCRLIYPTRLKEGKARYSAYVRDHLYEAGAYLMDLGDTGHFSWLLHHFQSPDEKDIVRKLSQRAAKKSQPQMQSIIMSFTQEFPSLFESKKRLKL